MVLQMKGEAIPINAALRQRKPHRLHINYDNHSVNGNEALSVNPCDMLNLAALL